MALKSELIADTKRRQQRLRELRDMTQDHGERVRLDNELDRMQLTLSDLGSMDEEALRARPAEIDARARAGARRAWPVAVLMLVLAVVGGSLLLARRRSHAR